MNAAIAKIVKQHRQAIRDMDQIISDVYDIVSRIHSASKRSPHLLCDYVDTVRFVCGVFLRCRKSGTSIVHVTRLAETLRDAYRCNEMTDIAEVVANMYRWECVPAIEEDCQAYASLRQAVSEALFYHDFNYDVIGFALHLTLDEKPPIGRLAGIIKSTAADFAEL